MLQICQNNYCGANLIRSPNMRTTGLNNNQLSKEKSWREHMLVIRLPSTHYGPISEFTVYVNNLLCDYYVIKQICNYLALCDVISALNMCVERE